jgi:hypothetical protein
MFVLSSYLVVVWSVFLRIMASDYLFCILKVVVFHIYVGCCPLLTDGFVPLFVNKTDTNIGQCLLLLLLLLLVRTSLQLLQIIGPFN